MSTGEGRTSVLGAFLSKGLRACPSNGAIAARILM